MYVPDFEAVHAWLQLNNEWLGPAIAFMALLESLVVVGLLVPGVPIMFALGAMAGAGTMTPTTMIIWGVVGAAIGDGISFQLGHHYHQKVRYWWPFNKHPEWFKKGEDFFHNHGDLSIALGRFIGPIRPVVPVVAGMLDMPAKRFYIVNILSAIPWAPVYLMPGFVAGIALQTHGQIPTGFFCLMLGLLTLGIVLPSLLLWMIKKCHPIKVLGSVTIGLFFITTMLIIVEYTGDISCYNVQIDSWLAHLRVPYFQNSMSWLTWLGSLKVLFIPALLAGAWNLYKAGKNSPLNIWLASLAGLEISLWILKGIMSNTHFSTISGAIFSSFPSFHTAQAVFFVTGLAIYTSNHMAYVPRALMLSTGVTLVLLVGLSRLVLHAHGVSDVITGLTLGACWLFLALFLTSKNRSAT